MRHARRAVYAGILIGLVIGVAAAEATGPRQGGGRATANAVYVNAIAALESVGATSGWGRIVIQDAQRPAGVERKLQAWLYGLAPGTRYDLEIEGVAVGQVFTRANGDAFLTLGGANGSGSSVPENLAPAEWLREVAVLDRSSAAVLEGRFTVLERGGGSTVYEERIELEDVTGGGVFGVAKVEIKDDDEQEFSTRATGLTPDAGYTIVVDSVLASGFEVGIVTADAQGQAGLELEWPDDDNPLPPELLPVSDILSVEWIGPGGLLLAGTFTGVNQADEVELEGTFAGLSGDGFTLDTDDGPVQIDVDANTTFKGFASLDDLVLGDVLEVEGWDIGGAILAKKVELDD